jgi:DNA end-binding protein Ku
MPPRSSWKGHLRLSLVSVPVQAFTANDTSGDVRLNQLHAECNNRVKYKKVCPDHGELKGDEIISGYEYAKDQYVVIVPDELAKLRPQSDKAVRIDGFIPPEKVDPVHFSGRTYYLTPDGPAGQKPYSLLRRGMLESGVIAVGQIVLAGRQQLVLLRPLEKLLTMSILQVASKVRGAQPFADEVEDQDMSKEELSLTDTLIQASTLEDFDYASYKDAYTEQVTELIRKKVEGEEIVQVPDREEPALLNLMDALKKSVAEAQSARKMAPSAKETKKTRKKKSG